jgi:CBS domain-containing protein
MNVKEVMTPEVEEMPADTPLQTVLERLAQVESGVLAVSAAGRLQGILSEHDVTGRGLQATWGEQ